MRKRDKFFLTCFLCVTLLSSEAFARAAQPEYTRTIRILKVQSTVADKDSHSDLTRTEEAPEPKVKAYVNGKESFFDVPPVIKEGRLLVPIRNICHDFEAEVKWDPETKAIAIKKMETNILLTLGSQVVLVNGQEVYIEAVVEAIDGRAVVPLRFVGESFGAEVHWESGKKTVVITEKS